MACFEEQWKNATDLLDDGFADSRCGLFFFVRFLLVQPPRAGES